MGRVGSRDGTWISKAGTWNVELEHDSGSVGQSGSGQSVVSFSRTGTTMFLWTDGLLDDVIRTVCVRFSGRFLDMGSGSGKIDEGEEVVRMAHTTGQEGLEKKNCLGLRVLVCFSVRTTTREDQGCKTLWALAARPPSMKICYQNSGCYEQNELFRPGGTLPGHHWCSWTQFDCSSRTLCRVLDSAMHSILPLEQFHAFG
jgi:hypothetical protein